MGKKRIVKKGESDSDLSLKNRSLSRLPKRRVSSGTLFVSSTYNNTILTLTDKEGNTLFSSSSGSIGFKGAKKGTPFAASKVGELVGEKASLMGIKDVNVVVRGVGAGRESAIRALASKGVELTSIEDRTPIPHNGPKPPRPRRV